MDPWLRDRLAGTGDRGPARGRIAGRAPSGARSPVLSRRQLRDGDELLREALGGARRRRRARRAIAWSLVVVLLAAAALAWRVVG